MEQIYPSEAPEFPKGVAGVATVKGTDGAEFTVDFNTGECDCNHGAAWRWTGKKWAPNPFCVHKMRALASLVDRTGDNRLQAYYIKELGRRYNVYVAVSTFHKELRRGAVEPAQYWATVLSTHRGLHGVVIYMRNVLFEETRDINLGNHLLKMSAYGTSVSTLQVQRAVERFCAAPKKWELPWRYDVFLDEQRGYRKLIKEFGKDVAKSKDIIPALEAPRLRDAMFEGFATADRAKVQYGLKGFVKAQSTHTGSSANDLHKIDLLNYLIDVYNEDHPNAFDYDEDYAAALYKYIMQKISSYGPPRYHELNAFCDALTGEPGRDPRATLSTHQHKLIVGSPALYTPPLADVRRVPAYANDNHTWHGKALMRKYGETELQPGAEQTHLDFRLCGAYMGVAWRILAHRQHGTIDCKWGDVSWKHPNWLWGHLDSMWY